MSSKKIKQLEEELEKVKQQAKDYLEGWQRVKADYINREREIERQRSEWIEFANLDFVLKILPIYENLNKSLEYYKKPVTIEIQNNSEDQKIVNTEVQNRLEIQNISKPQWLQGIEQIKKQFDEFLKNLEVEKMKTIGEKFNPNFHEVIEKKGEGDEIVEEISPGYTMGGKVIKVAKVIIK